MSACTTRVELSASVPIGLAAEIERRLLFVSAEITGYELITDGDSVTGAVLRSDRPADAADLARKVNLVVDTEIRPLFVTPAKVIWRSAADREVADGTFAALAADGLATEAGEGQVAIGGALLWLFDYFDRALLGVLRSQFAVTQYRYPTLIKTATLETAGYVSAFPQHLMFVTRLHNDIDVYREVADSFGGIDLDSRLLAACRNVAYTLPPTMCFHTFSQYRGRTIARGGVHVVSARGKAFRYEAGYAAALERLWDFTIREMVFLGTRDEVLAAREQAMTALLQFLDGLGVTGWCEVGNDPFFGDDSSDRVWSQRMMELKYELRLQVGGGRSIAVGSFNFHNDLFGNRFSIAHEDGGPAWSGCIGFGLERLVYAFVCQFGADERGWPEAVRATAGQGGALHVSGDEARTEQGLVTVAGSADETAERLAILRAIFAETLGIDQVAADASFFELGGNSLLATRLIARARSRLGVELSLPTVYETPTPAALADRIKESVRGLRPPLRRAAHDGIIPLAPTQRRIWFLNRLDREVGTYNMPVAYRLHGQLDASALWCALQDVTARHESLRTVYPDWNGPQQVVLSAGEAAVPLPIRESDEAGLPGSLTAAASYPFDVTAETPVRAELFRLSAREHILLIVIHHISCDGWSLTPLVRDLSKAYAARLAGQPAEFPEMTVQYADFAVWQQQLLEPSADSQALVNWQTAFWRAELAGHTEPLRLDGFLPRPSSPSNRGRELLLRIPAPLHRDILALAQATGTSAFMIVHAALAAALAAHGADHDIVIGAPAAGRTDSALDELVGFFVNTVLLRLDCGDDPRFVDLLARARAADLSAFTHQDVPFDHLVRELNPPRVPGWPPFFNVMLAFQNTVVARLELPGLEVAPERVPMTTARFDIRFEFVERLVGARQPDGIDLTVTHALDVCPDNVARRLADDVVGYLTAAVAHPKRRISRLGLPLGPEEDLGEGARDESARLPVDDAGRVRIAFVCSPYGQQWLGMGRTMYQDEPVFKAAMDECDRHIARYAGWSVVSELFADQAAQIDDVSVWQPVVFALQVALCRWLESRGVTPDAVVGHSLGEIAACVVSGILDLPDAARLVRHYTVQQRRIAGAGGGMLVAEISAAQMREHLTRLRSDLCIASSNGPRTTVVAGSQGGLERLLADLRGRDVLCALIRVDVPAHSPAIDAITPDLVRGIAGITPRSPRLPMISSVFGRALDWSEVGPDYFAWNLRRPVLLAEATRYLLVDNQFAALVEISANPILESALRQSAAEAGRGALVFSTMRRSDADDAVGPRRLLTELAEAGYASDA